MNDQSLQTQNDLESDLSLIPVQETDRHSASRLSPYARLALSLALVSTLATACGPSKAELEEAERRRQEFYALGRTVYTASCATCHGENGEGIKEKPFENPETGKIELVDVVGLSDPTAMDDKIRNGRGLMPSFRALTEEQIEAVRSHVYYRLIPEPEQ